MTTLINVQRICEHCGNEFTAKTSVTKYCSHICNKRAYKAKKRAEKIEASNNETRKVISKPIEELKAKPFLSISEASVLFGISRRTVYRMIHRKELPFAKAGARIILRRSDFENLFDIPKELKKRIHEKPVSEFYTVKEIEKIYSVTYGRLNTIIQEHKIPKTVHNGRLKVSKPHIDKYFSKEHDKVKDIEEWYSVKEIIDKYGLSQDQIYSRIHDHSIPKKREGQFLKVSKKHFDELFIIGV
jgi:excisionase family DNA binding protein